MECLCSTYVHTVEEYGIFLSRLFVTHTHKVPTFFCPFFFAGSGNVFNLILSFLPSPPFPHTTTSFEFFFLALSGYYVPTSFFFFLARAHTLSHLKNKNRASENFFLLGSHDNSFLFFFRSSSSSFPCLMRELLFKK